MPIAVDENYYSFTSCFGNFWFGYRLLIGLTQAEQKPFRISGRVFLSHQMTLG